MDPCKEKLIQIQLLSLIVKNGKRNFKNRKILLKNKNNTILRFGGLIGEERNPLKYLIQKEEILNSDAPINYIHLKDCIGIIKCYN